MYLAEIPEFRSNAMMKIASNQRIKDYLTGNTGSTDSPQSLINKYIYPYWRVPGSMVSDKAFILLSVFAPHVIDRTFKDVTVEVGILVPEGGMMCVDPDSGKTRLRFDLMANEIDKIFNGSTEFGMKLVLVSTRDYSPYSDCYGVILKYKTVDFNYKV